MDNKSLRKRRMMGYFIEATNKIIENEGVENVTIRKVADLAGYNSATLYNYFKNLNHLVFFASVKYLMYYSFSLPSYLKDKENSVDRFFGVWECFLYYSYNNPKIYQAIFFNEFSGDLNATMREYYTLYPEELSNDFQDLIPMVTDGNIYSRNKFILHPCVEDDFINGEDMDEINEMILLIYQGMLSKVINEDTTYTVHEAVKKTLNYIKRAMTSYLKKPYK